MEGLLQLKHPQPSEADYLHHCDEVRVYNAIVQDIVKRALATEFHTGDQPFALYTTGSDGRLEKGPVSPIEIALIGRGLEIESDIISDLQVFMYERGVPRIFDADVEVKDLDNNEESAATTVLHKPDGTLATMYSPNRIFDSVFLSGDEKLYQQLTYAFQRQLRTPDGRARLKFIKRKVGTHLDVASSGYQEFKGTELLHFDTGTGTSFYNPERFVWSFKQGPLRAVQYAIVRDKIKAMRRGVDIDYLLELPANTAEFLKKLEIERESDLGSQELRDLADSYKYFLWLYNLAQENYNGKGREEMEFDGREVKERVASLSDICKKTIIRRAVA